MLSLPHLIVLFVLALVIFGPQKLPELARMLGKATAEFRKMSSDFRYALEDEVRELDRQTRIRDEEIAAAIKASQSTPSPLEGAVPRDVPAKEVNVQMDPVTEASPQVDAPAPNPPEGVSAPEEKPADDHTAV
jgi:sec-independent protein translocase protein TatB